VFRGKGQANTQPTEEGRVRPSTAAGDPCELARLIESRVKGVSSTNISRGDRTAIELFRQGVIALLLQLSIANTALVAILAKPCSEQTSPK
jgi:hypothetical protein